MFITDRKPLKQVPSLPLSNCVTSGKLLALSEHVSLSLSRDNDT